MLRKENIGLFPSWLIDLSTSQRHSTSVCDTEFPYRTFHTSLDPFVSIKIRPDNTIQASGSSHRLVTIPCKDEVETKARLHWPSSINFSSLDKHVTSTADDMESEIKGFTKSWIWASLGEAKWKSNDLQSDVGNLIEPIPQTYDVFSVSRDWKWTARVVDERTIEIWYMIRELLKAVLVSQLKMDTDGLVPPNDSWQVSTSKDSISPLKGTIRREFMRILHGESNGIAAFTWSETHLVVGYQNNKMRMWISPTADRMRWLLSHDCEPELQCDINLYTTKTFLTANSHNHAPLPTNTDEPQMEDSASPKLHVSDQWICYGKKRLIVLPEDMQATCYGSNNNRIAVGCRDGRIVIFGIDCQKIT